MRELKFRTWFEDTNEMTKPWTIYDISNKKDPNFGFIRKEPFLAGTGGMAVGGIYLSYDRPHRIMQYTGLKDKNGVDIYEGDIFLIDSDCRGGIYIVSWNDKKANFCLFKKGWVINLAQTIGTVKYRKPEILGNQYENSELIKDNDNAF
jgi:uncharacterized phage protein (TIGR01671 family)